MGLDMYLNGRRYLRSFGENKDTELARGVTALFPELAVFSGDDGLYESPVRTILIGVGYWRNSRAIHRWFVRHVQEGVDDCAEHYVTRNKLEELRGTCYEVLKLPHMAASLLPTDDTYISVHYDEWYMQDLRNTIRAVNNALTLPSEWDFEYHSSW